MWFSHKIVKIFHYYHNYHNYPFLAVTCRFQNTFSKRQFRSCCIDLHQSGGFRASAAHHSSSGYCLHRFIFCKSHKNCIIFSIWRSWKFCRMCRQTSRSRHAATSDQMPRLLCGLYKRSERKGANVCIFNFILRRFFDDYKFCLRKSDSVRNYRTNLLFLIYER